MLVLQPLAVLAPLVEPPFLVVAAEGAAAAKQPLQLIVLAQRAGKTELVFWTHRLPHLRAQERLLVLQALGVAVALHQLPRHPLAAQAGFPVAGAVVVAHLLLVAQQPQAVLAVLAS